VSLSERDPSARVVPFIAMDLNDFNQKLQHKEIGSHTQNSGIDGGELGDHYFFACAPILVLGTSVKQYGVQLNSSFPTP
jgi:hypothetical protein